MKTSNKLFALLFIGMLGMSLLLVLSLRRSIQENNYTLENFDNQAVSRGIYTPYKTLKIIAPVPDVLRCFLLPASPDSMYYSSVRYYGRGTPDSVRVYNSADTLYVQYIGGKPHTEYRNGKKISTKTQYRQVRVNLHLSSFDDIVVDGGVVIIDSLWQPAKFSLINQGLLHLAETGRRSVTRRSVSTGTGEHLLVGIDSTYSGDFRKLTISAESGRLFVSGMAWIRDLKLDLRGPSYLSIDSTARIDQVTGFISARTSIVKAPPGISGKLRPLILEKEQH